MAHVHLDVPDAEHVVSKSQLEEFTYGVLNDVGEALETLIGVRHDDPEYKAMVSDYIHDVYLGSEEAFCRDAVRLEERAYALAHKGSSGAVDSRRAKSFAMRVVAKSIYDGEPPRDYGSEGSQSDTAFELWHRSGFQDDGELHWLIAGALMHEAEVRTAPAAEAEKEHAAAAA